MKKDKFKNLDDKIYNFLVIKEPFTTFFRIITNIGSAWFLIISSIIIIVNLRNKLAIIMGIFMLFEWGLNALIKRIIRRDRPNIKRLVKETGYSYPSGHTMSSTCFYSFLFILVLNSPMIASLKILLMIILILNIFMVALSRIYLGVHYFSDIVGAVLISLSIVIIYVYFVYDILNIF
ncbi:MAG: phosphatase PAP2 family protein [Ruminococcus sp.]|nr:phosphatase PAP2 family protein [Ruminococcus sp.]